MHVESLVAVPLTERDLLRAQLRAIVGGANVRRFHTLRTIQQNTVGHHSFGVAWLCWLLTEGQPSRDLLLAALSHDLAEQWTGDVPAPAKRALGIRGTLGDVETASLSSIGMNVPSAAWYGEPEELRILKLADALDGLMFCMSEQLMGNNAIAVARANFTTYANALVKTDHERSVFALILEGL